MSTEPIVKVFTESDFNSAAAGFLCDAISARLASAPSCSVGLSGGSTPGGIYRELAKRADVSWEKAKFFLGDERWVNESGPQSNTRMVRETLLGAGSHAARAQFFPPDTTLDCATGAVRYADLLVEQLGAGAVFDVMLLGVGDDGHTASIFPGSELLKSSPDLCAVARHPQNHSTRITVSRGVLASSRVSIFLAKGKGKASIIQRILRSGEPVDLLPVKMFAEFKGSVTFLLDAPAAELIAE